MACPQRRNIEDEDGGAIVSASENDTTRTAAAAGHDAPEERRYVRLIFPPRFGREQMFGALGFLPENYPYASQRRPKGFGFRRRLK